MQRLHAALIALVLVGCSDGPEEVSPADVRAHGQYCCTTDGSPVSGDCRTRAGAVYLEDYSHVDASGRGDACGWILNR